MEGNTLYHAIEFTRYASLARHRQRTLAKNRESDNVKSMSVLLFVFPPSDHTYSLSSVHKQLDTVSFLFF